jgi:hypothetical protein
VPRTVVNCRLTSRAGEPLISDKRRISDDTVESFGPLRNPREKIFSMHRSVWDSHAGDYGRFLIPFNSHSDAAGQKKPTVAASGIQ